MSKRLRLNRRLLATASTLVLGLGATAHWHGSSAAADPAGAAASSASPAPTAGSAVAAAAAASEDAAGAGRTAAGVFPHQFEYRPDAGAAKPEKVAVAGDFNGWSQDANVMHDDGDGSFSVTVPLSEGVHFYKFVVDGQWKTDPHSDADFEEADGYGGKNSAVLAGPDGRKLPPPAPGVIAAEPLHHDPADPRDLDVVTPTELRLAIRAQANNVDAAAVLLQTAADGSWTRAPLCLAERKLGFDHFGGLVTVDHAPARYLFELRDGDTTAYYAGGALYPDRATAQQHAYSCAMDCAFPTPDWAKGAVWYQIFPERFRNGDTANDPPNTKPWTSDWWAKLDGESGVFYNDVWKRRYGGDIQGIRQELPYLRSLGVTAIYLNPIFKAEDLHKYDTSDYRHVDDHFGFAGDIDQLHGETDDPATWQWTKTDKLFLDFVADAHKQGFKVILDGVFNHVGKAHYAFQDVVKNGKNSPYASWFEITEWTPDGHIAHYNAWDGKDGWLPALKKDPVLGIAHGPREHIIAITKRWMAPDGDASRGVDGFRLDVANGIPAPFWRDWRRVVKSIDKDALIVGEIWSPAPEYLRGDQFDATMNYPFAMACQSFFVDQRTAIAPSAFAQKLEDLVMMYPFQASLCEQNLLDSHDMDRWASRFVNPDRPFDGANRIQDNGPDYSKAKPNDEQWTRMRQSVVLQMTYAGAPMIYYGDEAGMWSPDDPSNRQPMLWKDLGPYADPAEKFDDGLFAHYQRLIAIHQAIPALQKGFVHTALSDDARGIVAFERDLGDQRAWVVLNRSNAPQTVDLPVSTDGTDPTLLDWLDPAEASLDAAKSDDVAGRPQISPHPDHAQAAAHGLLQVRLEPWGSKVLTAVPAHP